MNDTGGELAALRERIAQTEHAVALDRQRISELRDELSKLPAPPAGADGRTSGSLVFNIAIMCAGVFVVIAYLSFLRPTSDFGLSEERATKAEIVGLGKRRDTLRRLAPIAEQQRAEHANRAVARSRPLTEQDHPCISRTLAEAGAARPDDAVALRWAEIGMAACRTRQADLIGAAFQVLSSKEGEGADADGRGKLRALVYRYCVKQGVSPAAATVGRSFRQLQELRAP